MDSTSSAASDNQSSTQKMCLACNQTFGASLSHCPKDGTQLVPFGHDENLGKVINDRFKVLELVGKGGMGSVYLAEDLSKINTYVAIKMLHAQLSEDKVSVLRFQQEASAASDLQHPNLIQQFDYGMIDGKQPFLVMEYLQGDSLSEIIREEGPMNPVRCLRIFSQAMDGLHYAHNKGVVHRDIKPSNILIIKRDGEEDLVKVLDFGLAKLMPWSGKESQHLTKTGEVFGSPIYMSPEQCMGKKLEPSSDIYSLGITLFETLTGKPPFKGQNVVQTASKHLSEPPPTFESICPELNLPLNLQHVVFKALEKEKAHRYLSMLQFKDDLVHVITGQGKPSAHMQAAMNADETQHVKKVDLDNLRASTQSLSAIKADANQERKGLPKGLVLGGIVGALLLVGGTGFMFFSKKSSPGTNTNIKAPLVSLPQKCKGTVYYLALKPGKPVKGRPRIIISEVHLRTDKGLVKLTSSSNVKKADEDDLQLGKEWQVDYKGDDKTGELTHFEAVSSDTAQAISLPEAVTLVENFHGYLADQDYQSAFDMLTQNYCKKNFPDLNDKAILKKLAEIYSSGQMRSYHGKEQKGLALDGNMYASIPGAENKPPVQASKIIEANNKQVKVMVNSAAFYLKPKGYELFTIVQNPDDKFPKIDDITSGLSEKAWTAEPQ